MGLAAVPCAGLIQHFIKICLLNLPERGCRQDIGQLAGGVQWGGPVLLALQRQ